MEGLAGYGSDSSSSSDGGGDRGGHGDGDGASTAAAPALSALLPDASSEEEETNAEDAGKVAAPGEKEGGLGSERKRRRRWDDAAAGSAPTEGTEAVAEAAGEGKVPATLPPPRLSGGGDPFGELVRFGSDRTARLRSGLSSAAADADADADGAGTAAAATAAASDGMSAKLDRMYRNFYSSSSFSSSSSAEPRSFASHLRSQHEFGNPDLFPSVVKHCGIDPMGTNVRARADWKPQDFEMVGRLVEAEERARAASAGGGGTHLALGQDGHPSLAPLDNN